MRGIDHAREFIVQLPTCADYARAVTAHCYQVSCCARMVARPAIQGISGCISERSASMNQTYSTLEEWIARDAIPFSLEPAASLEAAVDRLTGALGNRGELLA